MPARFSITIPRRPAIMAICAGAILLSVCLHGRGAAALAADGAVPAGFVPDRPAVLGDQPRWFKGNTHTHTWWSDGDSPPETVTAWYKQHGYDFLVLSDHNVLSQGSKWIVPEGTRVAAAKIYEQTFGDWVVSREKDGKREYLCKPLPEVAALFQETGRFLLIQGEEISDSFDKKPVHLNGVNLIDYVPPQHGESITDTIQRNVDAVRAQAEKTGQPMFVHINHPNFGYALRGEDLMRLRGDQFFEVFNGHPGVHNYGDEKHCSVERMWDIVLTKRLAELNLPVMYAVAVDDAHRYTEWGVGKVNPGRGWVMVRATSLTPAAIVTAMERGDFYASTGVTLREVEFKEGELRIEIEPRDGVSYTTKFVGTLDGYDPEPVSRYDDPKVWLTNRYSDTIGQVLAEREGTSPSYRMTGKEIYVRATITSTASHPNPYAEGDVEMAWTQPVLRQK